MTIYEASILVCSAIAGYAGWRIGRDLGPELAAYLRSRR